jgi:hypothetical protein
LELEKKILKRMGYLQDQKGIKRRYKREFENWKVHVDKTKKFILQQVPNDSKVLILGSGYLFDVPIEGLLEKVSILYLVDINHPREVLKKFESNPKCRFVVQDVGGNLISTINQAVKSYKKDKKNDFISKIIDGLNYPEFRFDFDTVVSVNILNQLDIIALDYIKSKINISDDELQPLREKIQSLHIQFIAEYKGVMITDYRENVYHKNGDLKSGKDLLYAEIKKAAARENWVWDFDSKGLYNDGLATRFDVLAAKF